MPSAIHVPQRIVLCATQRSGSSMIVDDLRRTGVLGQPKEWFGSWCGRTSGNWADELRRVYELGTSENGVFGVKVMWNQVADLDPKLLAAKSPRENPKGSGVGASLAAEFADSTWCWIRRRDVVRQAVSRLIAEQTGVYHATARPEDYSAETQFDSAFIKAAIAQITHDTGAWLAFFTRNHIEPMILFYEDLIDAGTEWMEPLTASLGITLPVSIPGRSQVRLSNEKNERYARRFIERHGEVAVGADPT